MTSDLKLKSWQNFFDNDAYFLEILITNGVCSKWCPYIENKPERVNFKFNYL